MYIFTNFVIFNNQQSLKLILKQIFVILSLYCYLLGQVRDTSFFTVKRDTIKLPNSDVWTIVIKDTENHKIKPIDINYYQGIIMLDTTKIPGDTILITYKYFVNKIKGEYKYLKDTLITFNKIMENPETGMGYEYYQEYVKQKSLQRDLGFSGSKLKKSGSLSRAITAGNNQDMSVYSDFRLNLEGELADSIEVKASITDANLPIQPDGTTQSIQDFDRVFIEISRNPYYVILGDYEVFQNNSSFANFYRNLLGVQFGYKTEKQHSQASIAVAKGKFYTNSFPGENGKQGPYQLKGRNGETLITVLAGSEKVYINGQLKKRGYNNDYIIDYNTGQITFTNNVVITNVTRIVVDFEYVERNYARTMQFLNSEHTLFEDKLKVKMSYVRDADNPNAPLDFEFGKEEYNALKNAGDDPAKAVIPGIDTVSYDSTQILYAQKDTIINNTTMSFFYYSRNPDSALYKLTFTYVGEGNGQYVKDATLINGNIFRWVGPGKGNYEPIKVIPLPQQRQVFDMMTKYNLSKNIYLLSEFAMSSFDKNRLSSIDDSDNNDFATKHSLGINDVELSEKIKIGLNSFFQYVGKRYENIDRVYPKEYGRIWNYNDLSSRDIERAVSVKPSVNFNDKYMFVPELGYRSFGDSMINKRFAVNSMFNDTSFLQGNLNVAYITSDIKTLSKSSGWLQSTGDIFVNRKSITIGSKIWIENKINIQDTMLDGSFRFSDLTPYVRFTKKNWNVELSYNHREDYEQSAGEMRYKSLARMPGVSYNINSRKFYLSHSVKYRQFFVKDSVFRKSLQDEQQWISQLNTRKYFLKNAISTNVNYNLTTHKVPRKDIVFVRVNPGFGQYEWKDYNNDGVQQLDEFQPAINPLIADYVRVLLPSKQYESVITNAITFSYDVNWKKIFSAKFPSGIKNKSIIRFQQQHKSEADKLSNFLPWGAVDSVVNKSFVIQNHLFLLRHTRKHKIKISQLYNESIQAFTLGYEHRKFSDWSVKYRV